MLEHTWQGNTDWCLVGTFYKTFNKHTHTHTNTHTYMYIHTHTHTVYICVYIYIYIHTHTHIYIYVCVCVCIYIYMCVCVCVCTRRPCFTPLCLIATNHFTPLINLRALIFGLCPLAGCLLLR